MDKVYSTYISLSFNPEYLLIFPIQVYFVFIELRPEKTVYIEDRMYWLGGERNIKTVI